MTLAPVCELREASAPRFPPVSKMTFWLSPRYPPQMPDPARVRQRLALAPLMPPGATEPDSRLTGFSGPGVRGERAGQELDAWLHYGNMFWALG